MKTKFYLDSIVKNIPYRPEGYYEEVIAAGDIIDNYLELNVEDAVRLVKKYYEKNPAEGKLFDKTKWGPVLWLELHNQANKYTGDEKKEIRWLQIFNSWIPCGECKQHWLELTKSNPVDLSSSKAYVDWAIKMHNEVNKSLGKPIYEPIS